MDKTTGSASSARGRTRFASPSPMRVWRVAAGLRQSDLARLAGVSEPQVNRIEAGHSNPRLSTARALAAALSTTVDELFPATAERDREVAR
jgi:DNA-binding XRE family transcriptional regulator